MEPGNVCGLEGKGTVKTCIQTEWDDKADKACSLLTLRVEQSQRIIFQNVSDNPIKIWTALEAAHIQRCPGTRFNAYNDFFSIRKKESELLQTLIVRINDVMSKMQTYVLQTLTSNN